MLKKRSQVSLEFLTIVGFALVMLFPLVIIFNSESEAIKDQLYGNQIENICRTIVDKAESMYYLGSPSQTTLKVMFPPRIENVTITNRELKFYYINSNNDIQEIYETSLINITGSVSSHSGIHYILIKAEGDYVSITD